MATSHTHTDGFSLGHSDIETLKSLSTAAKVVRRQADISKAADKSVHVRARFETRSATCKLIHLNILMILVDHNPLETQPAFLFLGPESVELLSITLHLAIAIDLCQEYSDEGLWNDYSLLLERVENLPRFGYFSPFQNHQHDREVEEKICVCSETLYPEFSSSSLPLDYGSYSSESSSSITPAVTTLTLGQAAPDTVNLPLMQSSFSEINFSRPLSSHPVNPRFQPAAPPFRPITPPNSCESEEEDCGKYILSPIQELDETASIVERPHHPAPPYQRHTSNFSGGSNSNHSSISADSSKQTPSPVSSSGSRPLLHRIRSKANLGSEGKARSVLQKREEQSRDKERKRRDKEDKKVQKQQKQQLLKQQLLLQQYASSPQLNALHIEGFL